MAYSQLRDALDDLVDAFERRNLASTLAWQDVNQRYNRSRVGAFWLTISMAVLIGALSMVFGNLLRVPVREFLPFLAAGIILWAFISSCIDDGCMAFVSAQGIILQVRLPLITHVFRVLQRNMIILAHNIVILPVVLLAVGAPITWQTVLVIPGFVLLSANLFWIMLVAAVICTRFRDMTQIIQNALQIFFYITPIIWMPKALPADAPTSLLQLNPFFHLISVVRDPLLGQAPPVMSWVVNVVLLLVGLVSAVAFFGTYKRRIAYWL